MDMIKFRDVTQNTIYVPLGSISAVVMPGPLTPGNGRCRVCFIGGASEVTREEAEAVLAAMQGTEEKESVALSH